VESEEDELDPDSRKRRKLNQAIADVIGSKSAFKKLKSGYTLFSN
jgi:hypothetical protein